MKDITITLKVTPEELAELDRLRRLENASRSSIIRRGLYTPNAPLSALALANHTSVRAD